MVMKLALITEKEAAHQLGCSVYKLQRDRRIGSQIPYYRIGRSIKYSPTDIQAYLDSQRYTSTSQYNNGGKNAV